MNDIIKLRELVENGYRINNVNTDGHGKAIINLMFSGMGNPLEGQFFYMVTEDEAVITKAEEIMQHKSAS
ncbi:MAG: hypothetical protein HGA22_14020 [Clostridiales bacterium]|nr:hypothetical protein [Clostridiales bacterium]